MKRPCVYIMASNRSGTLYVGVTSDVARRAAEHRAGAIKGFTKRYGCKLLVWLEPHERMDEAITREKQIKCGSRKDKLALIERESPLERSHRNLECVSGSSPCANGELRRLTAPWIATSSLRGSSR